MLTMAFTETTTIDDNVVFHLENVKPQDSDSRNVTTSIHFLKRTTAFEEEKPYAFRYDPGAVDVPQTNMEMEEIEGIEIKDMRGLEKQLTLERDGIEVLSLQSKLKYDDFHIAEKLPIYFKELEVLLKARLRARKVLVFRHGLRKRHPDFPTSTGQRYDYDQPTSVAHVDTTPQEMLEEVQRQMGGQSEEYIGAHVQWINVWKPLRGPLNDWPLTVCSASCVEESSDLEAADLLYPDLATENYQVYHKPGYQWYFLSNHDPNELIVFNQAQSGGDKLPGERFQYFSISRSFHASQVYRIARSLIHEEAKTSRHVKASRLEPWCSTTTSLYAHG
jgi:hypothetical protein